jgi:type I restriction enzyme S subunit
MQEKASVPAIRFNGFTDAWEQRKLWEIADFSKGSGYSKADIQETGTPLILYGRLYTKYELVISDVDTFAKVRPGSVYSKGGEVIIPASGETAEDISIAAVVEKPGVLLGGDLNIVSPSPNLDAPFLALTISHGRAHDSLSKRAQGKSVVHLHNDDLQTIDIFLPSPGEQKVIGNFFRNLDNLITLHQREHYSIYSGGNIC